MRSLSECANSLIEQGQSTRMIMDDLLDKAKKGHEDMTKVQSNMETISASMTEMSNVVQSVDSAAQRINSIVGRFVNSFKL